MHNLNKFAYVNVWQFCSDIFFLLAAFGGAYYVAAQITNLYIISEYFWVLIVYIPIWIFIMSTMGMYKRTTFTYIDRIFRNVVFSTLMAGLAIAFIFFYTQNIFFSRSLYSFFIAFTILFLLAERYALLFLYKAHLSIRANNVIILGTQELIDKYEYFLNKTQIPMNIIGYVQLNDATPIKRGKCLGKLEEVADILKNSIIDEIIITIPRGYLDEVEKCILLCEEMGITVRLALDLYDLKTAHTYFTSIGTLPMITFHSVSLNDAQLMIKRLIDILGSIIGLLVTAAISVFVIPAIKIGSPGPVFFKQDRVGLNGRVFKLYKFRSMSCDAEEKKQELMSQNRIYGGLMFKVHKDPRVTTVGKLLRRTSIDELPQFWNILKGDMSLVGTRPPTLEEVSKYLSGHRRRISIKPGLTGLWQISGRSSIIDFDEVVRLDTCYIDKWSVMEDFKIILKTIPAILVRRGAM